MFLNTSALKKSNLLLPKSFHVEFPLCQNNVYTIKMDGRPGCKAYDAVRNGKSRSMLTEID